MLIGFGTQVLGVFFMLYVPRPLQFYGHFFKIILKLSIYSRMRRASLSPVDFPMLDTGVKTRTVDVADMQILAIRCFLFILLSVHHTKGPENSIWW